jgi:succinyl-CoA synthetase beta subunit
VPKKLGLEDKADQIKDMFKKLYSVFWAKDCDMIEINPLVVTK